MITLKLIVLAAIALVAVVLYFKVRIFFSDRAKLKLTAQRDAAHYQAKVAAALHTEAKTAQAAEQAYEEKRDAVRARQEGKR